MFYVHSSYISNMKNIKGNIYPKKVSAVNTELSLKLESKKGNVNDILN